MRVDEAWRDALERGCGLGFGPARPAYSVGEEIEFTRARRWWEFWKPRFEQVRGTVVQAGVIDDCTDQVIVEDVVLRDLSNRHIQGLEANKRKGITGEYFWLFDRAGGQWTRQWRPQLHHLLLTGDWRWLMADSTVRRR
jgi:hypothetical protein